MPKILIGISIALVALSGVLGFLNTNKLKGLRNQLAEAISTLFGTGESVAGRFP